MNLDFATTAFLANMALAEAPSMDTLTPDETRLAFSEIYKSMPPGPEDVASETLEVPVDGGSIDCRILRPSGTAKSVIIYYHGGGWVMGNIDDYDLVGRHIAKRCDAIVVMVNYRKAPEHKFPVPVNDCYAALHWAHDNMDMIAGGKLPVIVAGDSAGGNLTLAAVNALKSAGERLPDAVIAFSPATDLSWGSASLSRKAEVDPVLDPNLLPFVSMAYVQDGTDMSDPRISPLEGNLFELPPTLIQCGEAEILLDDSRRYATQAQDCGSPVTLSLWPDMPHVFVGFAPLLSAANAALKEAREFLDETLV